MWEEGGGACRVLRTQLSRGLFTQATPPPTRSPPLKERRGNAISGEPRRSPVCRTSHTALPLRRPRPPAAGRRQDADVHGRGAHVTTPVRSAVAKGAVATAWRTVAGSRWAWWAASPRGTPPHAHHRVTWLRHCQARRRTKEQDVWGWPGERQPTQADSEGLRCDIWPQGPECSKGATGAGLGAGV